MIVGRVDAQPVVCARAQCRVEDGSGLGLSNSMPYFYCSNRFPLAKSVGRSEASVFNPEIILQRDDSEAGSADRVILPLLC